VVKRRTDAPLTILVIGITAVVLLGVGVIKYTGQTPILQIPPAISERWGYHEVVARFRRSAPGGTPWVEVELPAAATTDRLRMAEVGAFTLDRYIQLAPNTQVDRVVVAIKERLDIPPVDVSVALARKLATAANEQARVLDAARRSEARDVEVQLLGLSASGVEVRVTGKAASQSAADRTAAAVTSIQWVGRVEVELEGADGPLKSVGGRDARPPVVRR
jgi:hypothetical protein